jgi:hypothetical protein
MVEVPSRHTEADTRRLEDVGWREKVRAEDLAWREKVRAEDLAWREKVRAEDLVWRENVRAEDLVSRNEVRAADHAERNASSAQTIWCLARGLAFLAAAQNAESGKPTDELAHMAQEFTKWIGGVAGMTDQDT